MGGFREKALKLRDVKAGDSILPEDKNEVNDALRELAKAVDTHGESLLVEGDIEVKRALFLGFDLSMARIVSGDERFKRALVVVNNPDRLIINYNGDFEGGTEIQGNSVVIGNKSWIRLRVYQATDDYFNIFTEKPTDKHVHVSLIDENDNETNGVLEITNADVWIQRGVRVEGDVLIRGKIIVSGRCAVCGEEIKDGDIVVFRAKKHQRGVIFEPVHLKCVR